MIFFSEKHLCLLLHAGFTLAVGGLFNSVSSKMGLVLITSNTTYNAEDVKARILCVEGDDCTLEFKNSRSVYVDGTMFNYGRMILSTDATAVENFDHHVDYYWAGFYNKGLLVMHHENRELPISVLIYGLTRPRFLRFSKWDSENCGTIIFLSNARKTRDELVILPIVNFINLGTLSVLGTPELEVPFEIKEHKQGAPFTNTGIIYVKHAVMAQTAHLAGEGCVVLGEKGRVFARTKYKVEGQHFHFFDGTGALMVYESEDGPNRRYIISNFPKGSYIRIRTYMTRWRVEGSDFIIIDAQGKESITVTFEEFTLEKSKIVIYGNQMTYAEDLVNPYPNYWCAKVKAVMEEASEYEIRS